jgi:hypothetical protein
MDVAMLAVAEKLAAEFPSLPNETVVRVLTDCADEFPDADAKFVEDASRAQLSAHDGGEQT